MTFELRPEGGIYDQATGLELGGGPGNSGQGTVCVTTERNTQSKRVESRRGQELAGPPER